MNFSKSSTVYKSLVYYISISTTDPLEIFWDLWFLCLSHLTVPLCLNSLNELGDEGKLRLVISDSKPVSASISN